MKITSSNKTIGIKSKSLFFLAFSIINLQKYALLFGSVAERTPHHSLYQSGPLVSLQQRRRRSGGTSEGCY